ncbi:alpha/beta fold hydrolase [Streptomyces sp. NRRL F-5126]|uniref:alpha/beta fold hydrolase n=1 Tax=Streptomyces sp. NRRL F-5126 TaxID=1463857 RepID=UPI0004C5B6D1|nr:alpha/beta hydrolase [Streptomyces sp. NRRL F-5126]
MSINETARTVPVVLAHGAWADGSSWSRVIRSLRERGVKATAAPLPLTSLADDVTALDRTLERVGAPALLVGHAYAGAVIGSVAPEKVSGLVHVAALAPDEGETVADVFYREPPHPQAPDLKPDADGLVWLPDAAFGNAFAQDAPPEELAVLAAVQRPIAIGSITTAVGAPAWRTRPAWYVLAERDRMIAPAAQRFMAGRMHAAVRSGDTDHAPLVTAAKLVSDVIVEAVHEIGAGR